MRCTVGYAASGQVHGRAAPCPFGLWTVEVEIGLMCCSQIFNMPDMRHVSYDMIHALYSRDTHTHTGKWLATASDVFLCLAVDVDVFFVAGHHN